MVERKRIPLPSPYSNFHSFFGIINSDQIQPFTPFFFLSSKSLDLHTGWSLISIITVPPANQCFQLIFSNTTNNSHSNQTKTTGSTVINTITITTTCFTFFNAFQQQQVQLLLYCVHSNSRFNCCCKFDFCNNNNDAFI